MIDRFQVIEGGKREDLPAMRGAAERPADLAHRAQRATRVAEAAPARREGAGTRVRGGD